MPYTHQTPGLFPEYSGALFDPSERYRYRLWRVWDRRLPRCLFVMLNPSTADYEINDLTVRRCIDFAHRWGYGGLEVCNLFAFRSTDPAALYEVIDPVGAENDRAILEAATAAGVVVVAWGNHGQLHGRGRYVTQLLEEAAIAAHCLGVNDSGEPKHPLYVSADTLPTPYLRRQP
jgi:hypothetical protein